MKIVNIDVKDKIIINNIEDIDTGEATGVSSKVVIPTGNYNNIILNFDFNNSKLCEDLNMFANFKVLCGECIDVALEKIVVKDREFNYACYIPSEVLAEECEFLLGLYGFVLNEDETLKQRVSFVPIKNSVVQGTYDPDSHEGAMPTPSVFEVYFQQVQEINEQIENEYQGIIDRLEEIKEEHINDFNEKIEPEKQNAINDINTQADKKLEEVKEDIDNHFEVNGSSYRKDINSNTFRIKRLETDIFDSGEASGSSIHLEDSTLSEFQELEVDGTHKQETTKGYNLLVPNKKTPETINGVTFTPVYENNLLQYINVDGTATDGINFFITTDTFVHNQLLKAEDYILTDGVETRSNETYFMFVDCQNGIEGINSLANNKITVPEDTYIKARIVVRSGVKCDNLKFYPMLRLASVPDDTYEPYTGGQASPSQNWEQPIEVIEEDFDVKSSGSNLIGLPNVEETTINGLTFSVKDGLLTLNGTLTLEGNASTRTLGDILFNIFPKAKKYRFEIFPQNGTWETGYIGIRGFNEKGIQKWYQQASKQYIYMNSERTIEELEQINRCDIYIVNGSSFDNFTCYVQLKEDETYADYEPYQETKVTFELPEGEFFGSVRDTIKDEAKIVFNEDDGQYHKIIKKNVGKVVLDGSENIWIAGDNDDYWEYQTTGIVGGDGTQGYVITNYFNQTTNSRVVITVPGGLYLRFPKNIGIDVSTVELMKAWLSNNNVEVYYRLAKPYTLDLGVVDMPLSYYPVTNVSSNHKLQPNIKVKYYRDIKNTITSMQTDIEALKQAVSTLTTNQVNLSSEVDLLQEQVSESEVVE